MSEYNDWKALVAKTFPQGHAEGFAGYPLLGEELPADLNRVPGEPWQLRLTLNSSFSAQELAGLLEDVEQICLCSEALSLRGQVGRAELYLEADESEDAWSTDVRGEFSGEPLQQRQTVWRKADFERTEVELRPDGQILRNLALVQEQRQEGYVVVSSSQSAGGEAEALIGDVLAYWCGAVGGAHVLEVSQQPGEKFESLWNRLCAVRLLRYEADLAYPEEPLAGAGFFTALAVSR